MKAKCPKCGEVIDVPDIYIGRKIVCTKCGKVFKAEQTSIQTKSSLGMKVLDSTAAAFLAVGDKDIICPNANCDYKGLPKKKARGSDITLLGLIIIGILTLPLLGLGLIFLIPAIFYWLFRGGYNYSCPKCGIQIRSDN